MRLILIRHGESVGNVSHVIQGSMDLDLTQNGYEQAEKLGERLKEEEFDIIYSSDLKRAKHTAHAILQHHEKELIMDEVLREIHFGSYQGLLRSKLPKEMEEERAKNPDFNFEDGESFNDVIARIKPFFEKIKNIHNGQRVIVVCHGDVIRSFLSLIDKQEKLESHNYQKYKFRDINNTGIYEIDLTNYQPPKIIRENCTIHL